MCTDYVQSLPNIIYGYESDADTNVGIHIRGVGTGG